MPTRKKCKVLSHNNSLKMYRFLRTLTKNALRSRISLKVSVLFDINSDNVCSIILYSLSESVM